MRITNSMMTNKLLQNLNQNLRRMDKSQQQLATGKKFNMPSDDPIGVSKSLELNTTVAELEQYKKNSEDALSWLEITENAVANVGDILQRARELTVKAANGVNTNDDRIKIKSEIDQLRQQLIQTANTTYAGKFIFSGYKTNQKLLEDDSTDPNYGKYNIDSTDEPIEYEVGKGDKIDVNTLGYKLFGLRPTAPDNLDTYANVNQTTTVVGDEAELIAVFDALSNGLQTNSQSEIESSLSRIDKHLENVLAIRADIGAKSNRMELTLNRIEADVLNFTELLSKNEDADLAEVIMKFKNDENVYRASLSTGAQAIQPSLVDFIK